MYIHVCEGERSHVAAGNVCGLPVLGINYSTLTGRLVHIHTERTGH